MTNIHTKTGGWIPFLQSAESAVMGYRMKVMGRATSSSWSMRRRK